MIRITELRLAIDHVPEALEEAIVRFLKIAPKDVISFEVFKRSYDARKNVVLAARPSMGKTAFAINIAEHSAFAWPGSSPICHVPRPMRD